MDSLHIVPHSHKIQRTDRNRINGHASCVLWFTGLSGSGKSTLADAVEQALHSRGVRTYLLDGDNIRSGLNADLDFSAEGREENIRRIAEVAKLFADAGTVVLTAFISPYKKDREKARKTVGADTFVEIWVDCPLEICEQRDVKGLYAKARAGQIKDFTGIHAPFEAPDAADLVVRTAENSLSDCVQQVLATLETHLRPVE